MAIKAFIFNASLFALAVCILSWEILTFLLRMRLGIFMKSLERSQPLMGRSRLKE